MSSELAQAAPAPGAWRRAAEGWGPFAVVLILLALQVPWSEGVSFQRWDEGYNGVQAVLYGRGYRFYTDMWLDQPPLLFVLLNAWFYWFGATLSAGRALALLSAVVAGGAFYHAIRLRAGRAAAALALVFMACGEMYAMMSVTMVQTFPALALAGLSCWSLARHRRQPRPGRLALSAACMAASLQVKLIAAPLMLALAADLLWPRTRDRRTFARGLAETAAWCGLVGAGFVALGLWTGLDLRHLLTPHWNPVQSGLFQDFAGVRRLPGFFAAQYLLMLLSLPAAARALLGREREAALPLLWVTLSAVLIYFHRPVWDHYEVLVAVPLGWLAGVGCAGAPRRNARGLALLAALAALAGIPVHHVRLRAPAWRLDGDVRAAVAEYRTATRWMAAVESQVYPFVEGLRVIPELASTAIKRLLGSELGAAATLELIERYRPEQVLLDTRFPPTPALARHLQDNFRARLAGGNFIQWVRRETIATHAGAGNWLEDPLDAALLGRNAARMSPYAFSLQYLAHGNARDAARLLRRALRIRTPALLGSVAEAHELLGEIALQEGQPGPAMQSFQEALRLKPDLPRARARVRQLYRDRLAF